MKFCSFQSKVQRCKKRVVLCDLVEVLIVSLSQSLIIPCDSFSRCQHQEKCIKACFREAHSGSLWGMPDVNIRQPKGWPGAHFKGLSGNSWDIWDTRNSWMFICFHLFSFVFIIFHPLELRLEAKYSPAEVDCSWAFLLNAMVHKIHSPGFGLADSGDAGFLHQLIHLIFAAAISF